MSRPNPDDIDSGTAIRPARANRALPIEPFERSPGVGRGLASSLVTSVTILGGGIVTGILAARLLGPAGRGALAAVVFWPQLAAGLSLLSLNEATAYQIGLRPSDARIIRMAALYGALALAILAAAATCLMLPWLLGPDRISLVPIARLYTAVFLPFQYVFLGLSAISSL
jgi:O-antigen/teichoic acid export membrane protein